MAGYDGGDVSSFVRKKALAKARERTSEEKKEELMDNIPLDEKIANFYESFEIVKCLGEGAQGDVLQVKDKETGLEYAAKTLSLVNSGWDDIKKLEREAEVLQKINHPNIVGYHGYGQTVNPLKKKDEFILLTELVEGKSLTDVIKRGHKLEKYKIQLIAKQASSALKEAHQNGITHRDIKPSNIMLTNDLDVKITDFGVAKLDEEATRMSSLGVGTLAYMSPEQLGEGAFKIGPASDLYSLGLTLLSLDQMKLRKRDINFEKPEIDKLEGHLDATERFTRLLNRNPAERKYWDEDLEKKLVKESPRILSNKEEFNPYKNPPEDVLRDFLLTTAGIGGGFVIGIIGSYLLSPDMPSAFDTGITLMTTFIGGGSMYLLSKTIDKRERKQLPASKQKQLEEKVGVLEKTKYSGKKKLINLYEFKSSIKDLNEQSNLEIRYYNVGDSRIPDNIGVRIEGEKNEEKYFLDLFWYRSEDSYVPSNRTFKLLDEHEVTSSPYNVPALMNNIKIEDKDSLERATKVCKFILKDIGEKQPRLLDFIRYSHINVPEND